MTQPEHPSAPAHEVHLVDGRFMAAQCSCGWRTAGRRSRSTVRSEARDHALLYADGRELAAELAADPRRGEPLDEGSAGAAVRTGHDRPATGRAGHPSSTF